VNERVNNFDGGLQKQEMIEINEQTTTKVEYPNI